MHDYTEEAVSRLLMSRAEQVAGHVSGTREVLRRARRRRTIKAFLSAGVVVSVVAAGVVGVGVLGGEPMSIDIAGGGPDTAPRGEPLDFARPIASGTYEDVPWWFFDSANSANCPSFGLGDRFEFGSMGPSCSDTIRPRDVHFSRAAVSIPGFEHFSPIYGVVGEQTDKIQIKVGIDTFEPAMYTVDDHPSLHYFLLFLDSAFESGRVEALDAEGEVVRSVPLCAPMVEPQRMQVCSVVTDS